jgi:hypothetical protein
MHDKVCDNCKGKFLSTNVVDLEEGLFASLCTDCKNNNIRFRNSRAGFIYIIGNGEFWKCGSTSRSPELRLKDMQTGNPHELQVLTSFLVRDCRIGERLCQNRLKDFHFRAEWYKATQDEILSALNKNE